MSLIHVTKDNFNEVKASDKPALLDPDKTPNGSKQYLLTRECGSYLLDPEARPETAFSILDYYLDSRTPEIRKLREIRISAERVTVETVEVSASKMPMMFRSRMF